MVREVVSGGIKAPHEALRLCSYVAAWLAYGGVLAGCVYYCALWASIWGAAQARRWLVNCAATLALYYAVVKTFFVLLLRVGALVPRIARIPLRRFDDVENLFAARYPHAIRVPGALTLLGALALGRGAGVIAAVRNIEAVAAASDLRGVDELLAARDTEAVAAFVEHHLDDVHAVELSRTSRVLDAALFLLFALVAMPGALQDLVLEEGFAFVPVLAQGILPAGTTLRGESAVALILFFSGALIAVFGFVVDAPEAL
ncbi:hypothetical protein M885DRAFT_578956 [Pelagophyceae sp. CCMP2097]|nr:hypothetical protein M885DRAFT_578956 [Pelagophyceae sp. CCMP2097]